MPYKNKNKKELYEWLKKHSMSHKMTTLVLLSTILGALCGIFFPEQMLSIRWIDSIFMNLLKVVALPLIFFSIVSAIISIGNMKCLKSIWIYSACYILISVSVAVLIGIVLSNFFKPGFGMSSNHILLKSISLEHGPSEASSFLKNLFQTNMFTAVGKFEILPIVFFSIVFGIACTTVGESAKTVISFFLGMRNVFNKIITWLMYLTPIGLFAILGSAIAEAYTKETLMRSIGGLSVFIMIFLLGLTVQFLWQVAVIKFFIRRSPKEFIFSSASALMMAFATSSSLSTLPMTLLVAKEHKIKPEIANFILPISATVNLAGTAMYEAVSALFFCQILGIHLSIPSQIGIFFTSMIAGMGAAGIPEGGLVTMVMVLRSVNIPTSAIAMLLPFDRILDRLRTMVNVWGDLVCAATVNNLIYNSKNKKVSLLPYKAASLPSIAFTPLQQYSHGYFSQELNVKEVMDPNKTFYSANKFSSDKIILPIKNFSRENMKFSNKTKKNSLKIKALVAEDFITAIK